MSLERMLSEIKERAEKATPEYRTNHPKLKHHTDYLIGVDCCDEEPFVIADMNRYMENWKQDLHFIANARTDIPRLLACIELLQHQRNKLITNKYVTAEGGTIWKLVEMAQAQDDDEVLAMLRGNAK